MIDSRDLRAKRMTFERLANDESTPVWFRREFEKIVHSINNILAGMDLAPPAPSIKQPAKIIPIGLPDP